MQIDVELYRVRYDGRGGLADQLCDVTHGLPYAEEL